MAENGNTTSRPKPGPTHRTTSGARVCPAIVRRPQPRVNLWPVAHPQKTPFTVAVNDLMYRPGEMREYHLDIVAPERFGNAMIGVPAGGTVQVDLRLEALHDGRACSRGTSCASVQPLLISLSFDIRRFGAIVCIWGRISGPAGFGNPRQT